MHRAAYRPGISRIGGIRDGRSAVWVPELDSYNKPISPDGDLPERVAAGRVTADFFAVFGVAPLIGRTFRSDEDSVGHEQVVVLSEGLWTRRFGADRAILNRTTRINGLPVTVVGVMPASFDPSGSGEELWMPLALTPAQRLNHDDHGLFVVGLLAPGVTLTQARADGVDQHRWLLPAGRPAWDSCASDRRGHHWR